MSTETGAKFIRYDDIPDKFPKRSLRNGGFHPNDDLVKKTEDDLGIKGVVRIGVMAATIMGSTPTGEVFGSNDFQASIPESQRLQVHLADTSVTHKNAASYANDSLKDTGVRIRISPQKPPQPDTFKIFEQDVTIEAEQIRSNEIVGMNAISLTAKEIDILDRFKRQSLIRANDIAASQYKLEYYVAPDSTAESIFEKGSQADKEYDLLLPIIRVAQSQRLGSKLIISRDEVGNYIGLGVLIEQPVTIFTRSGDVVFNNPVIFAFDSSGSLRYLEEQLRPGGQNDRIGHIFVKSDSKESIVEQINKYRLEDGRKISLADEARLILGQYDEKNGDIVSALTPDQYINFKATEENLFPTATPVSKENKFKTPVPKIIKIQRTSKLESPIISERGAWDSSKNEKPVLSNRLMEIIRNSDEKAILIPGTGIALDMTDASSRFWDRYFEEIVDFAKASNRNSDLIRGKDNLVIAPTGKSDEEIGKMYSGFVGEFRQKAGGLTYINRFGQLEKLDPEQLKAEIVVKIFDMDKEKEVVKKFFGETFQLEISDDEFASMSKSDAYFDGYTTNILKIYDEASNTEYLLVAANFNERAHGLLLDNDLISAIEVSYTPNAKKVIPSAKVAAGLTRTNRLISQLTFKCGSLKLTGLIAPGSIIEAMYQITDNCQK